jgi:uncharacterized coiled-coil DUF342 family protein
MADDQSARLGRFDHLLEQLDKVRKQAADLHQMATELSREAAASIRAAKSVKPIRKRGTRVANMTRRRARKNGRTKS